MTFTPLTYQEHVGPYLLGTYETELHQWWQEIGQRSFGQIVDVGAYDCDSGEDRPTLHVRLTRSSQSRRDS